MIETYFVFTTQQQSVLFIEYSQTITTLKKSINFALIIFIKLFYISKIFFEYLNLILKRNCHEWTEIRADYSAYSHFISVTRLEKWRLFNGWMYSWHTFIHFYSQKNCKNSRCIHLLNFFITIIQRFMKF